VLLGHTMPHVLQLAGSLVTSTHLFPHGVKPELHVNEQAPELQTAVALATLVVQACPQPPQSFTSLIGSRQVPPQRSCPVAHAGMHA
jgi:hypothetical protein